MKKVHFISNIITRPHTSILRVYSYNKLLAHNQFFFLLFHSVFWFYNYGLINEFAIKFNIFHNFLLLEQKSCSKQLFKQATQSSLI